MREGWVKRNLGDLVLAMETIDPAKKPEALFRYVDVSGVSNEKFEIVEISTLRGKEAPSRARRKIRAGDVMFATIRPTLKRIAIVPPELDGEVCSTGYFVFRAKSGIDNKFLFYYLLSPAFMAAMDRLQTGASYPAVNEAQVKQQSIFVPPLPEQQRIVIVLDEVITGLATAIANTEKSLARAGELFSSALNGIFEQRDQDWISTTIGDLVERGIIFSPQDGNHGEIHPKKSDFIKAGVPFVMASDLSNGAANCIDCNFISSDTAKGLRKGFAENEDVLLSHKGTIGRTAILNTEHPFVVLTPQVTYYRMKDKGKLFNRYVRFFFESPSFKSEMSQIANSGSTRAYIGITKQQELKISYPPLQIQQAIAEKLGGLEEDVRQLKIVYQQKLNALAELKESILQKAFSGELISTSSSILNEAAE